jgi:hypothetical protein
MTTVTMNTVTLMPVQVLSQRSLLVKVFIAQLGQAQLNLKTKMKTINKCRLYIIRKLFHLSLLPILRCVLCCLLVKDVVLAWHGLSAWPSL